MGERGSGAGGGFSCGKTWMWKGYVFLSEPPDMEEVDFRRWCEGMKVAKLHCSDLRVQLAQLGFPSSHWNPYQDNNDDGMKSRTLLRKRKESNATSGLSLED